MHTDRPSHMVRCEVGALDELRPEGYRPADT
jgi:hypothetical protein